MCIFQVLSDMIDFKIVKYNFMSEEKDGPSLPLLIGESRGSPPHSFEKLFENAKLSFLYNPIIELKTRQVYRTHTSRRKDQSLASNQARHLIFVKI